MAMVNITSHNANLEGFNKLSLAAQPERISVQSNGPPKSTLLSVLSVYPIFDTLCSHMDIGGLITLEKISKELAGHLATHKKERWNINKRLTRFVRDPIRLRSLLGKHDALISGSFVIQFFDGVLWKESDLDLYVEDGMSTKAFNHHLIEVEGYKLIRSRRPEDEQDDFSYQDSGIVKTNTYERQNALGETIKIQIVCVNYIPIQTILQGFYTTAVVNAISWNKAYSMFPYPTFIQRKTYDTGGQTDIYRENKAKYLRRGWETLLIMREADLDCHPSIRTEAPRYLADSKTWTMPLDTTGLEIPETPDVVLENAHFSLHLSQLYSLDSPYYYRLIADNSQACVLKYKYTEGKSPTDFWIFMRPRLDELTVVEFRKMNPHHLPAYLQLDPPRRNYDRFNGLFRKPETWIHADENIPQ